MLVPTETYALLIFRKRGAVGRKENICYCVYGFVEKWRPPGSRPQPVDRRGGVGRVLRNAPGRATGLLRASVPRRQVSRVSTAFLVTRAPPPVFLSTVPVAPYSAYEKHGKRSLFT